jgi:ABC-type nitrate/sulfonate/bicarbonate transport system substrate-binding protein
MSTTFGRGLVSRVALASLGLLALALPARAQQVEHTSLALPAVAFIFSSAYIAEDAGIFKSEGLEVKQQVITGIGAANAVIAGSIDFSFSSGVTLTRAAAREQPVIGIAGTYDRTGFWVLLRKSVAEERHFDPNAPLAERAKTLKGLRFGVGAIQAIPHAYLKMIAKIGGMDGEKDIVVAGMAPPDQVGAMQRGAVDGVSSGPPVVEQLLHDGLAVVVANGTTGNPVDPPWLSHVAANVLLTRLKYCDEHHSICVKMGHAMAKASAFMHQHPKEAMAMLGKRLNVKDPAVLAEAYQHTLDSTPLSPVLDGQGLETADRMNVEAGFMKKEDMLPSYTKIFTNEFVK